MIYRRKVLIGKALVSVHCVVRPTFSCTLKLFFLLKYLRMSFEYILVARLCSPGLLSRKLLMKLPLLLPESRSRNSPRLKINVACNMNVLLNSNCLFNKNQYKQKQWPPGVWRGPCCQKQHCLCPAEAPGCSYPLPPKWVKTPKPH